MWQQQHVHIIVISPSAAYTLTLCTVTTPFWLICLYLYHAAGDATHRSAVTTTSTAADLDSEVYSGVSPQASSLTMGTSSRPMSAALRDVRGSRPNSAAIAAQIEGFENDFLVGTLAALAKLSFR